MPAATSACKELEDAAPPEPAARGDDAPALRSDAEPPVHSRRLLLGSILLSCLLHMAAATAALVGSRSALPDYGVITSPTDAVSLESTQTVVLESIETEPIEAVAAASAAMAAGSVEAVDAQPEPLAKAQDVPLDEEMPLKAPRAVPEAPETSEDPLEVLTGAAEAVDHAKIKAVEPALEEQKEKTREERAQQRPKSQQQTAGGPSARASAVGVTTGARVSASRGSILSYAARVRAKVARNKPSGTGRKGVAQVSFAIAPSGDLSYARLSRSSGSSTLDSAALAAVERAAPFDPPPADAAPDELRFAIPFYFR